MSGLHFDVLLAVKTDSLTHGALSEVVSAGSALNIAKFYCAHGSDTALRMSYRLLLSRGDFGNFGELGHA